MMDSATVVQIFIYDSAGLLPDGWQDMFETASDSLRTFTFCECQTEADLLSRLEQAGREAPAAVLLFLTSATADLPEALTLFDRAAQSVSALRAVLYVEDPAALAPDELARLPQPDRLLVLSPPSQPLEMHRLAATLADLELKLVEQSLQYQDLSRKLEVNRSHFQQLLENTPQAIIITDRHGRIKLANDPAARMFGYTRRELVGQSVEILLPESLRDQHRQHRAGYLAQPSVRPMGQGRPLTGRHKNGDPLHLTASLSYLQTETGPLVLTYLAEARPPSTMPASEQATWLRDVILTMGDWIWETDAEGRYIYCSDKVTEILGYLPEEVVGHTPYEFIVPEERRTAFSTLRGLAERKLPIVDFETWVQTKDGQRVCLLSNGVPVLDEQGRLKGYRGVHTDITARKQAEEKLAKTHRELEMAVLQATQLAEAAQSANRAKSQFLANMSHEIRTPLNGIIGMTSLLLDTRLTPEQREYAETIRVSSDTLLTLVNDILDFSKIEAGKLELESQPFDLRECVESALDLLAPQAHEKGLELAYIIDEQTPPAIIGDVTRLRQILVNLVGNGIKFTDKGEVVVSVRSKKLDDGKYRLYFSVRDTGIGIPPDRKDSLFQSFTQLDASTTRKYGGTGLGLAISKRLSEMMGGSMWVESEGIPGKGSTFHFTIVAEPAPDMPEKTPLAAPPELRHRRVLIVDDNTTNRQILVKQTESWGMHPTAVASGREALDLLHTGQRFDIALLDMQMPEMDGLTLATAVKRYEQRENLHLPMVLLTSLGSDAAGQSGDLFAATLTKPVKASALFDTVAKVITEQCPEQPTEQKVPVAAEDRQNLTNFGRLHPLRILVAEDNTINQKVALRILAGLGYRADVVSNGLEVLEAVKRQPYDVILMDVQMPEMDGVEATAELRASLPDDRCPYIIAVTANALSGDRERYLAQGMDDYVSKPIRIEELKQALQKVPRLADKKTGLTARIPARPAEQPAKPDGESPINLDVLHATIDDDDGGLLRELVEIFFDEAPKRIAELHQALAQNDTETFRRHAHSLKSNGAIFGAEKFSALCKELEDMGRREELDGAAEKLTLLEQEYRRVKEALEKIVQ